MKIEKKKSFFFHYNKPKSLQNGKVTISVHFDDKCHFVDNVILKVPTVGRIRKSQPRFVMAGRCSSVKIDKNNIALIS